MGYLLPSLVPLLLLVLVFFQSPQDTVQKHFQAADAQRRAGNPAGAEKEYEAVLAEGYGKLGKVYAAEKRYQPAISALESARLYGPDSQEVLIDLQVCGFASIYPASDWSSCPQPSWISARVRSH